MLDAMLHTRPLHAQQHQQQCQQCCGGACGMHACHGRTEIGLRHNDDFEVQPSCRIIAYSAGGLLETAI